MGSLTLIRVLLIWKKRDVAVSLVHPYLIPCSFSANDFTESIGGSSLFEAKTHYCFCIKHRNKIYRIHPFTPATKSVFFSRKYLHCLFKFAGNFPAIIFEKIAMQKMHIFPWFSLINCAEFYSAKICDAKKQRNAKKKQVILPENKPPPGYC